MADYCWQCTHDLVGPAFVEKNDFAFIYDLEDDCMAAVLCEGCGTTWVNKAGYCLGHCEEHHEQEHANNKYCYCILSSQPIPAGLQKCQICPLWEEYS